MEATWNFRLLEVDSIHFNKIIDFDSILYKSAILWSFDAWRDFVLSFTFVLSFLISCNEDHNIFCAREISMIL